MTTDAVNIRECLGVIAFPDTPEQRDEAWNEITHEIARLEARIEELTWERDGWHLSSDGDLYRWRAAEARCERLEGALRDLMLAWDDHKNVPRLNRARAALAEKPHTDAGPKCKKCRHNLWPRFENVDGRGPGFKCSVCSWWNWLREPHADVAGTGQETCGKDTRPEHLGSADASGEKR